MGHPYFICARFGANLKCKYILFLGVRLAVLHRLEAETLADQSGITKRIRRRYRVVWSHDGLIWNFR